MAVLRLVGVGARALLELALELVAPVCCAACDEPLEVRAVFCPACAAAVDPYAPAARRWQLGSLGGPEREGLAVWAFAPYGGPLATAIARLKFGGRPDLARPLGALLGALAAAEARNVEGVVPLPLHPLRRVERGYDQAALLGGVVAARLGVPLLPGLVRRVRHTPAQTTLDRAARLANVRGAFACASAARLAGRRVLLLDDVATTGATLQACAEALAQGGAARVDALVLARAEAHGT